MHDYYGSPTDSASQSSTRDGSDVVAEFSDFNHARMFVEVAQKFLRLLPNRLEIVGSSAMDACLVCHSGSEGDSAILRDFFQQKIRGSALLTTKGMTAQSIVEILENERVPSKRSHG